jgi:hypothetical protein
MPPAGTTNPGPAVELATQEAGRIVELERKIRALQVQDLQQVSILPCPMDWFFFANLLNNQQKATINKYKERWDKVKDSMRRKKMAKAAAEMQQAAERTRIPEEDEGEE